MLLLYSCSDDSTGPVQDDPPEPQGSFEVSCVAEDGFRAEALVTPSGGSVEATGSNGVVYRLTVPAGALASDTTISITPLSSLDITGPGSFLCGASCGGAECCVTGALFEPEGLVFDTLVTLEIEFPADEGFPFDSTGTVLFFDEAENVIAACGCGIDAAARTLTASIDHFSGYGTGAPDCARLQAMLAESSAMAELAAGQVYFFYDFHHLISLASANRSCDLYGAGGCTELCEGFDTSVYLSASRALGFHRSAFLALHPASDLSEYNVDDIIREHDCASAFAAYTEIASDVQGFRSALRARILEIARAVADEGKSLCGGETCLEGLNLLYYVQSLGQRGYITDAAFLASVAQWIEDCCGGWRLDVTVDRTELLRCVISEGDEGMCIATATFKVTRRSGEPVEGVYVDCEWESGGIYLDGGETDAGGECNLSFTVDDIGYGDRFSCAGAVYRTLVAEVYDTESSEWVESDPVIITFRNFAVTTTIDYTYTSSEYEDGNNWGETSCTINGGGTNYGYDIGFCTPLCEGTITRTYTSSGCISGECGTMTVIGGADIPGCLIIPEIQHYTNDQGIMLHALVGLKFYPAYITDDVHLQSCPDGEECVDYWSNLVNRIEWPGYGGIPEYWENTTGTFEPYTWTFELESETRTASASLTITVEASH